MLHRSPHLSGYSAVLDVHFSPFPCHSVFPLHKSIPSLLIYLKINFKTYFPPQRDCSSPANTSLYRISKRQRAQRSFRAGNRLQQCDAAAGTIPQRSCRTKKSIFLRKGATSWEWEKGRYPWTARAAELSPGHPAAFRALSPTWHLVMPSWRQQWWGRMGPPGKIIMRDHLNPEKPTNCQEETLWEWEVPIWSFLGYCKVWKKVGLDGTGVLFQPQWFYDFPQNFPNRKKRLAIKMWLMSRHLQILSSYSHI